MASSSSSSTTITSAQRKFDVFISFKGADTRDNITSHVYDALCNAKIQTFIDNDLNRGDDVSDALLRMIADSKISLVIFSENYASSRWCLDELVKIMQCNKENGQIVIPVFFKVDPSHVRNQSGHFGQALAPYEGHLKIQIWRDALKKAANLSGWDSMVERSEAMLVKSIVRDVIDKLYKTPSSNFGDVIGMGSHFGRIESLLSMINKDVRILGLWGMGGIGKTTLAREYFNHFHHRFEGHYIIENFRETCEKRGLSELRDRLVAGLLKDVNLNVGTPNSGIPFIRVRLCRMKVLIVLDDVDDFQHIETLVGQRDCLGLGSIVIITSRDQQVLKIGGVDGIYDVPGLDYKESLCLFSRYAFKQEHPPKSHHKILSKKAIDYAKGHPLAIKILGAHLCGRSKQEQESALTKLESTPNKVVQQVLRISYDGLDHQQKDLFLNIACLFKGERVHNVKYFHDACNYSTDIELVVLIDKSLITIRDEKVWMHDLLQEMGRQIVREESIEEPRERSRLWDYGDICHVLKNNTGTMACKGISLDMCTPGDLNINPITFQSMHNLEFLKIRVHCSTMCLPQGLKYLPNKLRCLDWDKYPLTYFPSNFLAENLVMLKMPNSHVKRLWNGKQNLVHLKVIDIRDSNKLIEIPDLSLATNLEYLSLEGCSLIKKFPEVPLKIKYLYLYETAIEEVPSTICNLKSLNALDLGGCRRLKKIPTSIFKLTPLQYFGLCSVSNNIHMRELTDQFVWLSSVRILNLAGNNFWEIPIAIKQLTNLETLCLYDCKRLQSLPQLPMNIRRIGARNCVSLEMVASPLSTAARGKFDSHRDSIRFNFSNCRKLDQNAINIIVADVESRLLHWEASYSEILLSLNRGAADIIFSGGDVPDWFNYKSRGSSLTAKLPPHWCNEKLFCLVFCVVTEFKQFPMVDHLFYDCHIRNNGGDYFSFNGCLRFSPGSKNEFILFYDKSLVSNWRKPGKAYNEDEILIKCRVRKEFRNCCTVKKCGVHLLYTHEIEDRYRGSVIQPKYPYGELTQFPSKQDCVDDDIEEAAIEDAKDNQGCHLGKAVEDSTPLRRRKIKRKIKRKTLINFIKFHQFGGEIDSKRVRSV